MAIVIDSHRTEPRAIMLGGGTVDALFDAHSTSGPASCRALFQLAGEEPYTFAGGAREVVLSPVGLAAPRRSFSRELRIVRVPGGGRRLRLDILLVVEEVDASGRPTGNDAEAFYTLTFRRTLAAEVRQLREASSRREVSETLGISVSTLARIENQGHIPSADTMKKLPKTMDAAKEMMSE